MSEVKGVKKPVSSLAEFVLGQTFSVALMFQTDSSSDGKETHLLLSFGGVYGYTKYTQDWEEELANAAPEALLKDLAVTLGSIRWFARVEHLILCLEHELREREMRTWIGAEREVIATIKAHFKLP